MLFFPATAAFALASLAASQKTPHASYAVHTPAELDALLNDAEFNVPDRIRLIEVFMPRWVPFPFSSVPPFLDRRLRC